MCSLQHQKWRFWSLYLLLLATSRRKIRSLLGYWRKWVLSSHNSPPNFLIAQPLNVTFQFFSRMRRSKFRTISNLFSHHHFHVTGTTRWFTYFSTHLDSTGTIAAFQSVYRRYNSTGNFSNRTSFWYRRGSKNSGSVSPLALFDVSLVIPRHKNKYAERAFAVACPSTWNKLPLAVREFQTLAIFWQRLKTLCLRSCISVRNCVFLVLCKAPQRKHVASNGAIYIINVLLLLFYNGLSC